MIKDKDIIKEGNSKLRIKSSIVTEPISDKILNTLDKMLEYLEVSQDEELSKKYKLRAGVGLAAPQIGLNYRMFAILVDDFKYGIINPVIRKESTKKIYLSTGEGCLSCPDKSGIVLRNKKIEATCILYNKETKELTHSTIQLEDYLSIVFQHEYDHLNGVLFIDKIVLDPSGAEAI